MVKRIWMMIIAMVIFISALGGCGSEVVTDTPNPQNKNDGSPVAEGPVKTGLSISADVTGSKDASETEQGTAKADVLVVAVTVDGNGVIDDCVIDEISGEVTFDGNGRIITGNDTRFESKNQLGDRYGMRQASGIGKEWNEQAAAFAEYVKGKTMNQIAEIQLDGDGKAKDSDLTASVTISVSDFVKGLERAVRDAESKGARKGDVITLGIDAVAEESKPAEGDDHGEASVHLTVVVETHNGQSVTSRETEDYTAGVKVDRNGKITERILEE